MGVKTKTMKKQLSRELIDEIYNNSNLTYKEIVQKLKSVGFNKREIAENLMEIAIISRNSARGIVRVSW